MLSAERRAAAATTAPKNTYRKQFYHPRHCESKRIELLLAKMLFRIESPRLTRGQRFLLWCSFDRQLRLFVEAKYGV